jgi:hypothetical protein
VLSDKLHLSGRLSSILRFYLNNIQLEDIVFEIFKYNTDAKSVALTIKGASCPLKVENNREFTKEDSSNIVHSLWNRSAIFHFAVDDPSNRSIVSKRKPASGGPHDVPLDSDFASELRLGALPGGNFTICPEHDVRGAPK